MFVLPGGFELENPSNPLKKSRDRSSRTTELAQDTRSVRSRTPALTCYARTLFALATHRQTEPMNLTKKADSPQDLDQQKEGAAVEVEDEHGVTVEVEDELGVTVEIDDDVE